MSALRAAVRKLDPDLALAHVAPLDALINDQIAPRRFNTWLLTAFGAAAVALTAIGLYSLLAYLVSLRRHEMALRLSIGATPRHVLGLIVRDVSAVVGIGASLGLAGGLAAATRDARAPVRDHAIGSGVARSDPDHARHRRRRGRVHSLAAGDAHRSSDCAANRVVQSPDVDELELVSRISVSLNHIKHLLRRVDAIRRAS